MSKALDFLKKEFLEMLPPTIFFFATFETVVFFRYLMESPAGFTLTTTSAAVIGALILGKSILIADALPLFNWFRNRRLVFNVLWRIALYMFVVLLFQVLEELIPLARKYGGISSGFERLSEEVHWPRFVATHIILAVFLTFYSVATAMIDVIGKERFFEAFFGWRKTSAAEPSTR